LAENSKLPKVSKAAGGRGFYDATVDQAQIEAWWRRWPRANIGIRTGEPSDLLVLDVDVDKGGPASLLGIEEAYTPTPPTLTALTPTGGEHRYFLWPGGPITITAGKLGSGLDTRGEGGYVVAPPSVRADGSYRWVDESVPPAEPPGWLLGLLAKREPSPSPVFVWPSAGTSSYGEAALRRAEREVVEAPAGQGNGVLNGNAYSLGRLVGAGVLDRLVVEEVLVAAALQRGRETEARARKIVESGMVAGMTNPRALSTFEPAR
jgi:hypothetical protein